MMKLSEFVAVARDHLSGNWAKGTYRSRTGAVCGISALERATMQNLQQGGPVLFPKAKRMLELKIEEITDGEIHSIPGYNDSEGIGRVDLENLMDKVIIGLEEVGE